MEQKQRIKNLIAQLKELGINNAQDLQEAINNLPPLYLDIMTEPQTANKP